MATTNYEKFHLVFTFKYGVDFIQYITDRECTDLDYMISYAKDWADKFQDKYGTKFAIEIYKGHDLVYDKYFD